MTMKLANPRRKYKLDRMENIWKFPMMSSSVLSFSLKKIIIIIVNLIHAIKV